MTGRKRIPTEIKRKKGTLIKSRTIENEMQPEPINLLPAAPAVLSKHGSQQWQLIVKQLFSNGILTETDTNYILGYCIAVDMMHYALNEIQKTGYIGLNGNGLEGKSAAVTILNDALNTMHKFAPSLGITPAARTKIAAVKPQITNKIIELMNKKI